MWLHPAALQLCQDQCTSPIASWEYYHFYLKVTSAWELAVRSVLGA